MNNSTKIKAVRLLTSSLMSSDLTPNELAELCQSFMDQDVFVSELGYHLHNLVSTTMQGDDSQQQADPRVEDVYKAIKRRRITHQQVLDAISQYAPHITSFLLEREPDLRDWLLIFKQNSTEKEWQQLTHELLKDEYFEYIMDRAG